MPLVTIKNLHKSFGHDNLFTDLSLKIYRNEKIGLIGANGCGKTTLFKILLSQEGIDAGEVVQRKDITIGYLPQEPVFSGNNTVLQEMHATQEHVKRLQAKIEKISHDLALLEGKQLSEAMREYDRLYFEFELAGGYQYENRIKTILAGVGITEEYYDMPTSNLSGGQLSRLGLAQVLISGCDLLLLDEPTNHLDLSAIEWLESFLRSYKGAAVIISHDRYLLDSLAVKIIELNDRRAFTWKGNYSNFLVQKKLYQQHKENELTKRKQFLKKETDFIDRNRNDVGMSKVARGRAKRLNKLLEENPEFLEKSTKQKTLAFQFKKTTSLSHNVLKCRNLSKVYDEVTLFKDLNFELVQGDKLCISGPNGTGKSTLLKIALGIVEPTTGSIKIAKTLKVAYLDQKGEELVATNSVIEELQRVRPDMLHGELRNKLGAFLFHGDDVFKKIENLSGGERNRLMLCKLVLSEPDVLVLDEPTNHLDIQSKEALEEALSNFQGSVIAVSHDRFFINSIAKKLLIIGSDKYGKKQMGEYEFIDSKESPYSYYSQLLAKRNNDLLEKKHKDTNKNTTSSKTNTPRRKAPDQIKHLNKYRIEQLEEMIMQTEQDIAKLKDMFGLEEYYKDHKKLQSLQKDVEKSEENLSLLYMAYEYKLG